MPLLHIRPISPHDNSHLESLVLDILHSYGCKGEGYASADPELKDMYATYQGEDCRYYVVSNAAGDTLGGGGFARLKGTSKNDGICEMQKLYFSPAAQGHGMGKQLIEKLISDARMLGYKKMYIETIPELTAAIHLYKKFGFKPLAGSLGNTGHTKCSVHMLLDL